MIIYHEIELENNYISKPNIYKDPIPGLSVLSWIYTQFFP